MAVVRCFRTWSFKKKLLGLGDRVRAAADEKYKLFLDSPHHPLLCRKRIRSSPRYEEVRILRSVRAILRAGDRPGDVDVWIWVWIGYRRDLERGIRGLKA